MKKFSKYIFTLAALAFATTACVQEDVYQKGAADVEGCYGVYFPTQEASGSHTYDPSQATEAEFTVVRLNSEGDITVPVKYTESHPGIFQVGELVFADGQTESTLKVTFPDSENGVDYKLSLSIEDPQYASRYNDGATNLDFSVLRVEWKYFLNPQTNKPANFTFTQNFWKEVHTGKVKYYEVNGVRTCVTETDPYQYSDGTGYGFFGTAAAQGEGEMSFTWYTGCKLDEEETKDAVYLPVTFMYEDSSAGPISTYDWYSYWTIWNPQAALAGMDFPTFAKKYNSSYPVSYYNNGTFSMFVHIAGNIANGMAASIDDYDIILEAEGFVRTDYTLSLAAGQSKNGALPVQFTTGADVAKVKYAVFEGELYAAGIAKNAAAIADGSVESVTITAEELATSNVVNVSLANTGVYTLVAVTYDAADAAQQSASVSFCYVAADDAVPVVVTAGMGSADKYVPAGVNTDTALEYWVYGKDLTAVQMGVFSAQDLAKDTQACLQQVRASKPVSAEILEAINGEGYVSVVNKLNPGTEYYLIVVANNGYETKAILSNGAYTTGDPHPVYMEFTTEDINSELLPASSEGYFGTYNYYAKTMDENSKLTSTRTYLGQVTISDSEIPDSEVDEYGYKSEYVNVKGIVPYAAELGWKEDLTFEYYGGVLYTMVEPIGTYSGYYVGFWYKDSSNGGYYKSTLTLAGGFIKEGYLSFVNIYGEDGLDVDGLSVVAFKDEACTQGAAELDCFVDILLIDPAKDDSGLAPKPTTSAVQLREINNTLQQGPTNYVETVRGNIRSIIDNAKQTPVLRGEFTSIKGERDAKAVSFEAEFSSENVQKTSKNDSFTKVANISLR